MKIIGFAVAFALACAMAWAQATSQIQGTVEDTSGAVIPGVEVKATQTETGIARTALSNEDGRYVLPNLPIGPYRLEVNAPGFGPFVQTGIVLQVASIPTVNISLKPGAITETVQVEANAGLVETQTTSVGAVIENQRIVELPLNGRNPVELIQLAGAAVPAGKAGTAGFPGGLNISVAGSLLSGVTYLLDGAMHNNPFDAVNLPFPFPDALQEFKVETSTMQAQSGLHSGGVVSAVVKSGGNEFHGNLFEFFRNGVLNARNANAPRRDTLKRNQYGGTIGGPIKKDRIFFFAAYQGTKRRSDPADRTGFVPTQRMLAGDFSGCDFAQARDPATGLNYPNNQVPVIQFSPQALEIVKKLPPAVGACGAVPFGPVEKIDEYQIVGRVDYQIGEKHSLFGRYMINGYKQPSPYQFSGNILDTVTGGLDNLQQSATIGDTYLFSPSTINNFRIAANRIAVTRYNEDYFSGCDIGVRMHCFVPHQTVVTVTGGFGIGVGTAIQATFVPTNYTVSNDVSMVRGAHQFGFGFMGYKYQHSQKANVFSAASFTFTGSANAGSSGVSMIDFLLGKTQTMTQGTPNTTFTYKWYYGLYAQDTWKISRRVTANVGLRWEPFLPQGINNGAVYDFDIDRFNAGVKSTVFKNAPAGLLYAGDPGFTGKTGVKNRYNQFAPRIGLAFDPKGDGKMAIRSSFGISYDFPNLMLMSTATTAPPFGNTVTVTGPFNFADPWAIQPGGNPFPGTFGPDAPFVRFGTFVAQQPDAKATTVYSWNLGVQRQLGTNGLISVSYLGTQTAHLWLTIPLNPAVLVPSTSPLGTCPAGQNTNCNTATNLNQRRIAYLAKPTTDGQYLGPVDRFETGGTVSYNGLVVSAQRRFAHVSVNGNYTWSHCIGDVTQASTVGGVNAGPLDPDNRRLDRGNCQTTTLDGTQALDRRHNANFTAVLEAPRFNGGGSLRAIASDWRLSTSYRALSGAFQTVTLGVDRQLTGYNNQRPNQIVGDPLCDDPNPGCWINRAAFDANVPFGTLGNLGRSNVRGPGFFEIDMALSRIFRFAENKSLELRGEAFNLTNSYRAGPVTTNLSSAQFGQILTALEPRIIQLAGKIVF
jgi:hypothetical protein